MNELEGISLTATRPAYKPIARKWRFAFLSTLLISLCVILFLVGAIVWLAKSNRVLRAELEATKIKVIMPNEKAYDVPYKKILTQAKKKR